MRITGPVLDAADPIGLASFYERLLGWAIVAAGVAWAVEAGATVAEHQPQEGVRVMLDPAGHPFCLFSGA